MRPKKIYLEDSVFTRHQNDVCRYWEYATEKRIKETDAEYTDLAQVWHTDKDIPEDGDACLLIILRKNDYCDENDGMCFRDYNSLNNPEVVFPTWEQVKMWAYLADLIPQG